MLMKQMTLVKFQWDLKTHSAVEITINDKGSGMSAEVIQNALLPFYSTKHSGTGLGLALCREIIEAHDGKLVFNNRAEGGLCVLVILPRALSIAIM